MVEGELLEVLLIFESGAVLPAREAFDWLGADPELDWMGSPTFATK